MTSKLQCPFCGLTWDPSGDEYDRHPGRACQLSGLSLTKEQWRRRPDPLIKTYTGSAPTPVPEPYKPKMVFEPCGYCGKRMLTEPDMPGELYCGVQCLLRAKARRESFASQAMAALITDPDWTTPEPKRAAERAVAYADALLDALGEEA